MSSHENYLNLIDKRDSDTRKKLVEWSEINSGSRNLFGLSKMLDRLKEEFKELNGEIEIVDLPWASEINSQGELEKYELGKAISIKKRSFASTKILFVGHMDTVFGKEHPFQTTKEIDENTLNGPGVADLKGGLLVLLNGLFAFEKYLADKGNPHKPNVGWEILINPDEEIGSPGSAELLEISARRNDFGLVFEPSLPNGNLIGERKGSGNFTAVIKGKSAHAGREFSEGRNAIKALGLFIEKIEAFNKAQAEKNPEPEITINLGLIEGGEAVNTVPDLAICRFNVRTKKKEDEKEVKTILNRIKVEINKIEGFEIEIHGDFQRKPKILSPKVEELFELLKDCGKELNLNLELSSSGGCCDGNNLAAAGLPNIDTLGVRGGNIHTEEEYVLLDSLSERARLLALFLMKMEDGEIKWTAK